MTVIRNLIPERKEAPAEAGTGPALVVQRIAWVDRLRGVAILLMIADHALALDGGHWLVRHTVLRLSLPLFMVTAAMVWKPGGPSTRRGRQLAVACVLEVLLSTIVLRLDGPGPVVLYALVLVVMAPRVAHEHPACVAVLGIVQMLYVPVPWAGYQPGLLVAYWCIGRLARDELAGVPLGWLPRWLGPVGRRPLVWYVGHLAVLAALLR